MKIALFKFKNCLGIDELEVRPGKITLIQGANGAGKSSTVETFAKIFTNKGMRPKFVHGDAEKAETYILFEDGTELKKTFDKDGRPSYVSVVKDGMCPKNVESYLKALVSEGQLNPVKWMELPDKEQNEAILESIPMKVTREEVMDWIGEVPSLFGKEIDLSQHALKVCKEIKDYYYNKRTGVNKEKDVYDADVSVAEKKIPEGYNVDEWRNVSLPEMRDVISKANKTNNERIINDGIVKNVESIIEAYREKCRAEISEAQRKSEQDKKVMEDKIAEFNRQISILEENIKNADTVCKENTGNITSKYVKLADEAKANAKVAQEYLNKNPAIDITPLEQNYNTAEEMKSYIRTYDELQEKRIKLAAKKKESEDLTAKVNFMRGLPQVLLSKTQLPIEGLSIDSNGNVLMNDLPIKNMSEGEKLRFVMNIIKSMVGPGGLIFIDGLQNLSLSNRRLFVENSLEDGYYYIMAQTTEGELRTLAIDESGITNAETGETVQMGLDDLLKEAK
jgi:energy-coupling factor transporter ATP-binding protein EcfA2